MKKAIALGIVFLFAAGIGTANLLVAPQETTHTITPIGTSSIEAVPVDEAAHTLEASPTVVENAWRPMAYPLDTEVIATQDNELHPTMATSGSTYFVGYTLAPTMMERNIAMALSMDGGQTYESAGYFDIQGVEDYPDIAHWGGNTFYGTFSGLTQGGYQYLLEVLDITNTETWSLVYWDWSSYGWSNIHALDIACHNSQEQWEYGAITGVASTDYEDYDITNGPHMFFASPDEEGSGYISWLSMDGANTSAVTMDKQEDMIWGTWDIYNETNDVWNTLYWARSFTNPLEGSSSAAVIPTEFDMKNPSIAAKDGQVVIVAQSNENGNEDIICLRSSGGGNWQTSYVTTSGESDRYPTVSSSGDSFVCTFVRNGNLYYTASEDNGATWSAPSQMNGQDGTVLSEYATADATSVGAIWSDTRNGNSDIYFGQFPVPVVGVDTVSGGFGVSATIANTGTADAENVDWSITLSGTVFLGGEATGTIDSLPAGSSTDIDTGLVLGIGSVDIAVTAGDAEKTTSGFVLGPFVLGVE